MFAEDTLGHSRLREKSIIRNNMLLPVWSSADLVCLRHMLMKRRKIAVHDSTLRARMPGWLKAIN